MAVKSPAKGLPLDIHDRRGLVFGCELSTGAALSLRQAASSSQPVWLHLNLTDARARAWLTDEAGLPEVALDVLLDSQTRTRMQRLPTGLVAVLTDLQHDFRGDPEAFADLRIYVEPMRVITARRRPLQSVDTLRHALEAGHTLPAPEAWLGEFVEALADNFARVVHELVDQVDELEDEIVTGSGLERRATLASIRRLLVRFRRHVNADRSALSPVRGRDGPLRDAIEHLDGIAQDIELVHERVRLLQEEVAALLAESTNRNLYVLSIVTTVLLPTTVVTGLWGMNVGGLPWQQDESGFFWACLAVLLSVAVSLALLRGSRVL